MTTLQLIAVKMEGKNVESFKLVDVTTPIRTENGLLDKTQTLKTDWFDITTITDIVVNNRANIIGVRLNGLSLEGSNGSFSRYPNLKVVEPGKKYPLTIFERVNISGVDGATVLDVDGRILTVSMDKLVKYAEAVGISNGKVVTSNGLKFISSIRGEYNRVGVKPSYELNIGPTETNEEVRLVHRIKRGGESMPGYWPEGAKLRDTKLNLTAEEKFIICFKAIQNWNFFIYSILSQLTFVPIHPEAMAMPTMGVNIDMTLIYNPNYVIELSLENLIVTLLHETYHILFSHPARIAEMRLSAQTRGTKTGLPLREELKMYNIAADLFVNKYVADQFDITCEQLQDRPHTVKTTDPFVTNRSVSNWSRGVKRIQFQEGLILNDKVDCEKDTIETLFKDLIEQKRRELEEQRKQEEEQRKQSQQGSSDNDDGSDGGIPEFGDDTGDSGDTQAPDNEPADSEDDEQDNVQGSSYEEQEDDSSEFSQEQYDSNGSSDLDEDDTNEGDEDFDPNWSCEDEGQGDENEDASDGQGRTPRDRTNDLDDEEEDETSEGAGDTSNEEYNNEDTKDAKQSGTSGGSGLQDEEHDESGESSSAGSSSGAGNDTTDDEDETEGLDDEERSLEDYYSDLTPRDMSERREDVTRNVEEYEERIEKIGLDLNANKADNPNDTYDTETMTPDEYQEKMNDLKNWKEKLKSTVLKAEVATQSRGLGLSAAERRLVDSIIKPVPINWEILLQRMFNMAARKKSSFKRPSRRPEISKDIILPGKARKEPDGLEKIIFAVDTSSSVGDRELRYVLGILRALTDRYKVDVEIMWWSDYVDGVEPIKNTNDLLKAYKSVASTGGTCATNMFKYITNKNGPYKGKQIHGLVIFTDGYIESVEPKYRLTAKNILWMIHSRAENTFTAPFGTTAYVNLDKL